MHIFSHPYPFGSQQRAYSTFDQNFDFKIRRVHKIVKVGLSTFTIMAGLGEGRGTPWGPSTGTKPSWVSNLGKEEPGGITRKELPMHSFTIV